MAGNIEWLKIDEKELHYHTSQYENPKEYTKYLLQQYADLFNNLPAGSYVLDAGCGAGAVTNQFAAVFPHLNFIGIDISEKYIVIAGNLKKNNTQFFCSSFEEFSTDVKLSAIICLQTISWMENYDPFVEMLNRLKPSWSLVTSLFYNGPVDAFIKIKDYSRTMEEIEYRQSYYNIYSTQQFNKSLETAGFFIDSIIPFEIKIDLPKTGDGMATYTSKLDDGKRIQISGPILMNWHTLLIKSL